MHVAQDFARKSIVWCSIVRRFRGKGPTSSTYSAYPSVDRLSSAITPAKALHLRGSVDRTRRIMQARFLHYYIPGRLMCADCSSSADRDRKAGSWRTFASSPSEADNKLPMKRKFGEPFLSPERKGIVDEAIDIAVKSVGVKVYDKKTKRLFEHTMELFSQAEGMSPPFNVLIQLHRLHSHNAHIGQLLTFLVQHIVKSKENLAMYLNQIIIFITRREYFLAFMAMEKLLLNRNIFDLSKMRSLIPVYLDDEYNEFVKKLRRQKSEGDTARRFFLHRLRYLCRHSSTNADKLLEEITGLCVGIAVTRSLPLFATSSCLQLISARRIDLLTKDTVFIAIGSCLEANVTDGWTLLESALLLGLRWEESKGISLPQSMKAAMLELAQYYSPQEKISIPADRVFELITICGKSRLITNGIYRQLYRDARHANIVPFLRLWKFARSQVDSIMDHPTDIISLGIMTFLKNIRYSAQAKKIVQEIPPEEYGNPRLAATLINFSARTKNLALARKVIDQLRPPLTRPILSNLLYLHLQFEDLEGAQKVLADMKRSASNPGSISFAMMVAATSKQNVKQALELTASAPPWIKAAYAWSTLLNYAIEEGESEIVSQALAALHKIPQFGGDNIKDYVATILLKGICERRGHKAALTIWNRICSEEFEKRQRLTRKIYNFREPGKEWPMLEFPSKDDFSSNPELVKDLLKESSLQEKETQKAFEDVGPLGALESSPGKVAQLIGYRTIVNAALKAKDQSVVDDARNQLVRLGVNELDLEKDVNPYAFDVPNRREKLVEQLDKSVSPALNAKLDKIHQPGWKKINNKDKKK